MLSYKINLSIFKRFEITQSIFSNCNGLKLEISNNKMFGENLKYLKINTLLNSSWMKREITREIRKYSNFMLMKMYHENLLSVAKEVLTGNSHHY